MSQADYDRVAEKASLLEKCIKEMSEYNMIDGDEEFITYYYLVKTEVYLKNSYICKGL